MTTKTSVNIRFVKCPRCRKILPELPDVPMYKCGWCGIVLEAKIRKPETNRTELPSQETDTTAKIQQDNVVGQIEDISSKDDSTDSPKVELSPDEDNVRRQDECDDSEELSHNRGISDGLSGSPDITSPRNEISPVEVQEYLENEPLGRSPERYRSISDEHGEWTAGSNSSNEIPSSGEISLEAEANSPEASEQHVEQDNQSQLNQDYTVEQKKDEESQLASPKDDTLVDEVQNLPEYEDREGVLPENDERSGTSSTYQTGESSGEIKLVGPDSPSGIISHENDIISPSAELVGDDSNNLPVFRSSSAEKSKAPNASHSIHAPRSPSKGSLVSFYLTSEDEQPDHSPREVAPNFVRFSSMDTLGSSHPGDTSSELNFRPGSTAYYPTSRSYYAYDGSESSYDGIEDHFRKHASRKDKDAEELRRNRFSGNNMASSEAERTYWATSPSHRATHHPWNRGKSTEANRYTGRNRMRPDLQEDVSRVPFPSRDHVASRRPASVSDRRHRLLPPHPAFNLSDNSSYSDPDKTDLLRAVCQLKDELQRMRFPNAMPNRRYPDDGNFRLEREMYADVSQAGRYNRHHDRAKSFGERCNNPRMAFSGEAAHYRHQDSCSCLNCCPQDRHYSAQLPPCSLNRKNGHRVIHTDHNFCDRSNSPSPHRYASSEPSSWGCEAKSDNQRLDEIKRLQLREKHHTAKRHLRPVAGGAPVIACYHCSELLQLPVDFLLFKKRYHQLMCNACRKVMKFSCQKGTHLVPYVPDTSAPPPPSEADDFNGASGRRNLKPASHSSSCQHVEHVSYSDDYGQSFCRSCSTEEASVILPSLDRVKRDSYNRKTSSSSSHDPIQDRKLKGILRESQRENEESIESVGPSSKTRNWRNVTPSVSEIEELPPLSNSPLHRLMGYSSPSKVFKR